MPVRLILFLYFTVSGYLGARLIATYNRLNAYTQHPIAWNYTNAQENRNTHTHIHKHTQRKIYTVCCNTDTKYHHCIRHLPD